MKIVGIVEDKKEAEELKYICKLVLIGQRARELAKGLTDKQKLVMLNLLIFPLWLLKAALP